MKLIEAMKLKKELQVKAQDLREKIKNNCANLSIETPVYGTEEKQRAQIDSWIQAHQDIVKQIRQVSLSIQKTNLNTNVEISVGGQPVNLSISEWIMRRRELANMEFAVWSSLSDKGLKDSQVKRTDGQFQELRVIRYFDPVKRDEMVDYFKHEPGLIDRKLEVINAVTEVVGL